MFLRLVCVTDGAPDTRQRLNRRDLTSTTDPNGLADHERVLHAFTQARLITLDLETAQISHGSLVTVWPRLREWIDADREQLNVRTRLA